MVGDKGRIVQCHNGNGELILDGRHGRRGRRRRRRREIVAVARRVVCLLQRVFRTEAAENYGEVGQAVEQSKDHHSEK